MKKRDGVLCSVGETHSYEFGPELIVLVCNGHTCIMYAHAEVL